MLKKPNTKILKTALFALLFGLIVLGSYFRAFEIFELQTLDLRFKIRPAQKVFKDIAIIEISDDTIEALGRWPFDREFHARLIDVLKEGHAAAVNFDVIFSDKTPSDESLIKASQDCQNVYFAYSFRLKEKPNTAFQTAAFYQTPVLEDLKKVSRGIGHINIVPDIDGKIRKIPLLINYNGAIFPQLSFLVAFDYLGIPQSEIKIIPSRFIQLGSYTKIPIDKRGFTLVNFAGKWKDTFKHYSYIDILKSHVEKLEGKTPTLNLGDLKDKICFVGLTATATHDWRAVPHESVFPMVGLHANIFNMIMQRDFLKRADPLLNLTVLLLIAFLSVIIATKTKPITSLIAIFVIFLTFIFIACVSFSIFCVWIDLFYPVFTGSLIYLFTTSYKYLIERNKRLLIERELDIARSIQISFLPEKMPRKEQLQIQAKMYSAKQVGGDLYDFIDISKSKLGVMIGDVSGKGVPAALYMAKVISEFNYWAKVQDRPSNTLAKLNEVLASKSKAGLFVTLFYMIIDTEKNRLIMSNGGHLPLILVRKEEKAEVEILENKEGLPLGLMEMANFDEREISLYEGDVMVLYTDGVIEARNAKREEFGQKRLIDIIYKSRDLSADIITNTIYKEINAFAGKAPQHDDITVITIKII